MDRTDVKLLAYIIMTDFPRGNRRKKLEGKFQLKNADCMPAERSSGLDLRSKTGVLGGIFHSKH